MEEGGKLFPPKDTNSYPVGRSVGMLDGLGARMLELVLDKTHVRTHKVLPLSENSYHR